MDAKAIKQARSKLKKIPRFKRQNYDLKGRVGEAWRRPRGIDNKQRVQKQNEAPLPKVGYGKPRSLRNVHPSGFAEALVSNEASLSGLDKGKHAVRIAGTVGGKKRAVIAKKAAEMGLRVLN